MVGKFLGGTDLFYSQGHSKLRQATNIRTRVSRFISGAPVIPP